MDQVINIDDQPVAAGFFEEGRWLSDYVTPDQPDILMLYRQITAGMNNPQDRIVACWNYVANQVKYKNYIRASIDVEGVKSVQEDYWQTPSQVTKTHIGNCANKAFLLASLLRNELPSDKVYVVLGNLLNGHETGHAWVQANLPEGEFIVEATRNDVPMLPVSKGDRYIPVHYFNDRTVLAVPGRTVMQPFGACYSEWLRDYLNWNYIEGRS